MPTGQLIECTVKWGPGKIFEGEWGPSQNITLVLPDGSEKKVYFKPGLEPHASLRKGQQVKVMVSPGKGGKESFTIVAESPTPNSPQSSPKPKNHTLTDEDKRAIAEYIEQQSKLLKFCLSAAQKECAEVCPSEESVRSLGISLYITAQKKFGF